MSDKWRRPVRYTLSLCILDVCVLCWSASPHLPPTWTCLGSPAERWAMWQTHAGLSQKLVTAQTFLPLALPSPLAFNTLHFPSGPPLPPSLGLGSGPDSEPRHRLFPVEITWSLLWFGHVCPNTVPARQASSRLTSPPHNKPPSRCACKQRSRRMITLLSQPTHKRVGVSLFFSVWAACRL